MNWPGLPRQRTMSTDSRSFSPLSRQADWLDSFEFRLRLAEQGRVISVGDGIAWIEGLPSAAMDEVLRFEDGSRGLIFHLGRERIGAILLSQGIGLSWRVLALPAALAHAAVTRQASMARRVIAGSRAGSRCAGWPPTTDCRDPSASGRQSPRPL